MKTIRLYYTKKEQNQLLLNLLSYLIFIVYTVYQWIVRPLEPFSWLITVVAFILLFFSGLKEYLNYLYKQAIHILTVRCDPAEGLKAIERLAKADLIRGFTPAIRIYRVLAAIDLAQADQLRTAIDALVGQPTRDYVLLRAYGQYKLDLIENKRTQAKADYKDLIALKDAKIKGKPAFSALFSWEDIEAEYEFWFGNTAKALKKTEGARTEAMNPRELNYHRFLRASAAEADGKPALAREEYARIANDGAEMAIGLIAKERLKALETNHEKA